MTVQREHSPSDTHTASLVDVSHCVWERICLLVLGADTQPAAVLAKRTALLLVCKEVGAATRPVPLQLDLRSAADSAAVKRLLCAAAVSRLWLSKDVRGDEILRHDQFRALSGVTLRELWASISCTDTLQPFRNLHSVHLQSHVLPKLYPAVLWGCQGLRRLSLTGYEDFCLTQLPAALVPSVKFVEVTPKPVALHSRFALRLPPGLALDRMVVHGSFHSILSHKAAPQATVDVAAMAGQCREVHLEAEDVVFQLAGLAGLAGGEGSGGGGMGGGAAGARRGGRAAAAWQQGKGVQLFLEELLKRCRGPATHRHSGSTANSWRCLEFRILGGIALGPLAGAAGSAAAEGGEGLPLMSPERFARELQHALVGVGDGAIAVSVHREPCSIFEPAVLRIKRI